MARKVTRQYLDLRMKTMLQGAGPSKAELRNQAATALAKSDVPIVRIPPAPRRRKAS
jgi:hypothetical protein